LYVASSGQHAGKTSASLGIVASLQKWFKAPQGVGFMKPVGQQSIIVKDRGDTHLIDKDVPMFKELLNCQGSYPDMSPVLLKRGYTKAALEGKIPPGEQLNKISRSFQSIYEDSVFTVVEGTGHSAVGTSVGLSNARVAKELNLGMVLVLNGGIGNTLDQFYLNKTFCEAEGASICGVILNKVRPEKLEQVRHYTGGALAEHGIPLFGCVPDVSYLGSPAVLDFEQMGLKLLSGVEYRSRHFEQIQVVSCNGTKTFKQDNTLYICSARNKDAINTVTKRLQDPNEPLSRIGLILTEAAPTSNLELDGCPVLCTPAGTQTVMTKIDSYTSKLNIMDSERTVATAEHYAKHMDVNMMIETLDNMQMRSHM